MLHALPSILGISFTLIFVRVASNNSNHKPFTYQDPKHLNIVSFRENWESNLRTKRERSVVLEDGLSNSSEPVELMIDRNTETNIEVDLGDVMVHGEAAEISRGHRDLEEGNSFNRDNVNLDIDYTS